VVEQPLFHSVVVADKVTPQSFALFNQG